mmetsp:Transcript_5495/g.22772  ORF Transcript_5495/g.22772 Transcript_5495/m.22772 type:complete len:115 (-) Transcript_5495:20-364(-)
MATCGAHRTARRTHQGAIQPTVCQRWHRAAASVALLPKEPKIRPSPLRRPPTSASISSPSLPRGGVAPRGRDGTSWVKTPGSLHGCDRAVLIVIGQPSDALPSPDEPVVISCET